MNRYRKISVMMYGDRKFRVLSAPQPNAQTLWTYLLTGPHSTSFPAAFSSGEAGLAEDIGWPVKAFRKAFDELLAQALVQVDWPSRFVFIPNALKHNPPESPNVVKAWRKAFNELPDCPLKVVTFDAAVQFLGSNFKPAFLEGFGEDLPEGFREDFTESEHNITEHIHRPPSGGDVSAKGSFGEFGNVRLTSEEHAKLTGKLNGKLQQYIDRLDRWGAEEPAKFRKKQSHYATILNWAARDGNTGGESRRPKGVVL